MADHILAIIQNVAHQLMPIYHNDEAEQAAWWLIQTLLSATKAELITRDIITLDPLQEQTLRTWIDQHVNEHKPLQYIIGTVPFGDLTIFVEPPVLIPRPETEEWCLALIEQWKPVAHEKLNILDLCTGSGCIALTLARAFPSSTITVTDISETALALARKNATYNKIDNVTFIQSDVYNDIPDDQQFDIIVSNPPYIAYDEWKQLDKSVRDWESQEALMADNHGLYIIERIIRDAHKFLKPHSVVAQHNVPQLAIEIGYQQGDAVRALMHEHSFAETRIWKDMEHKDRLVLDR